MGAVDAGNPQSLNLYVYVGNDPVNSVDPLGLCGSSRSSQYMELGFGDYCGGGSGFNWGGFDIDRSMDYAGISPEIAGEMQKYEQGVQEVYDEQKKKELAKDKDYIDPVTGEWVVSIATNEPENQTSDGKLSPFAQAVFSDLSGRLKKVEPTLTVIAETSLSVIGLPIGAARGGTSLAIGAVKTTAPEFFQGARYTAKVLEGMKGIKVDVAHHFPLSVDGYAAQFGRWHTRFGGDGKLYEWLEIAGSYRGKIGVFEYTKDAAGVINHRFFKF